MKNWDKYYKTLKDNALNGPDKKSFGFLLVETIDPRTETDLETIKDMIFASVEWFCIQHNLKWKEGERQFLANIQYIAGYYDKETCKKWREIITDYEDKSGASQ